MREVRPITVRTADVPEESWPGIVTWRTLLSADRTPTSGLVLGVAELAPGATSEGAEHRHDPPEAYFVLRGRGVVTVDGEEHPLEPGTVAYVPGDVAHVARNTGTTPLELLYVFAADDFSAIEYRFTGGTPPAEP